MSYDVLVVGAGHAGIEAALAATRMGAKVCLITSNLGRIGHMSCNPAIGGLAKGQLVKEVDALGGEMAHAIDEAGIQFRKLNTSKGPAVWSSRAQADKARYSRRMREALESVPGLDLREGMVADLLVEHGRCCGITTEVGWKTHAKTTVLTTGTFLNGLIHIGSYTEPAGRAGDRPSTKLANFLRNTGLNVGRMKTGTVPRLAKNTINNKILDEQWGEIPIPFFSFFRSGPALPQVSCFITYTNERTHDVIRRNLSKSALYSGKISGVGPRYCPSVEDKVVRFADKTRHQVFLEPEGLDTDEVYPNGLSNSLPVEVQVEFLRTIRGLESVEVRRPGYAIEYDFVDPTELHPWLETKKISGLFHAGQINGTSGYEEAAAQGLVAGINAALSVQKCEPFVLSRTESYIGVLIDDLVTKGTSEPYRMFTSRAEHRLYLREDNADQRLHEYGWKLGLIPASVHAAFREKMNAIETLRRKLETSLLTPTAPTLARLSTLGVGPIKKATALLDLMRRPGVCWRTLTEIEPSLASVDPRVAEQAEISVKYEGYIAREREVIGRVEREGGMRIPSELDFRAVPSLSHEVREKLVRIQPRTLGQASRISGVTPAAISVLSVYLRKYRAPEAPELLEM
ncbi:MAG: tRNA uridine-5-carboxymethylaminomethyl(34) synthesis enzyme MnmG [Pseudomonadota bacterium]